MGDTTLFVVIAGGASLITIVSFLLTLGKDRQAFGERFGRLEQRMESAEKAVQSLESIVHNNQSRAETRADTTLSMFRQELHTLLDAKLSPLADRLRDIESSLRDNRDGRDSRIARDRV